MLKPLIGVLAVSDMRRCSAPSGHQVILHTLCDCMLLYTTIDVLICHSFTVLSITSVLTYRRCAPPLLCASTVVPITTKHVTGHACVRLYHCAYHRRAAAVS